MKPETIGLAQRLGKRMRPLAFATGVLISFGLPVTYYGLEFNALSRDATRDARELSEEFSEAAFTARVQAFVPDRNVTAVRVLDAEGRPVPGYDGLTFVGGGWWDFYPPRGRAFFLNAGAHARIVEVTLSQQTLVGITAALFVVSAAVGVGLALVMYVYPVRVVHGIEGHVDDLIARQDSLLDAGRLLASTLDLREVLDRLTEIARSLPGIDVVRIWLRDEATGTTRLHSQTGARHADVRQVLELESGQGLTPAIVASGQPMVITDVLADSRAVNFGWLRAEGVVSFLGVPLKLADDAPVGALVCLARTRREWSQTEITLAETLGALAAVAIRNARNFSEMTGQGDRLRRVAELARTVSGSLDIDAVLNQVVSAVLALRPKLVCFIRLVDEDGSGYRLAASGGVRAASLVPRIPVGQGLTHAVAATRAPVLLEDAALDPRTVPATRAALGSRAFYGVPVAAGDTLFGVLSVYFPDRTLPTAGEREAIDLFAGHAAIAIRNARVFGESESRRHAAEELAEIGRVLTRALDVDVSAARIAEGARRLLRATSSVLFRLDQETGDLVALAVAGTQGPGYGPGAIFPRGTGTAGQAVQTRQPCVTTDVANDPNVALAPQWRVQLSEVNDRAVLAVPLIAQDRVIGSFAIRDTTGRVYQQSEIRLAQAFADQAAVALENARLFEESDARRRTAEALAEVGRVLAQELDPKIVGARIADSLCALLGTQTSALYRLDPESGDLVSLAVSGIARPVLGSGIVFPRGTGAAGLAVMTRRPVVTPDLLTDPRITLTPEARERIVQASYHSVLVVPLIVKDRVIGALGAGDRVGRVFNTEDIRLSEAFADQAALALENARLYEEATRRQHEAEHLASVARSLTETLDVANVGERIVNRVIPLFGAHSSCLALREPDGSLRAVAWGGRARQYMRMDHAFASGVGVIGLAAKRGAPVQTRDALRDPAISFAADVRALVAEAGDRAFLAVPLHAKNELIGVLSITDASVREYGPAEVALLQTFGDQAALALENARLYQRAQGAYEELSQAQAQLVKGETLRAMGELASGVAHHLNNLLAVVLGRLQLARAKQPPPDFDRHLELAERAAMDGAEVVRRMRGFSRAQPTPSLAEVDLNRLAEEVIELTRPRWQDEAHVRGVTIEARLDAGAIPPVPGDLPALREVLTNFIFNAIDALPHGGQITVRTRLDGEGVLCEVEDTGVGMSPEVQRRALEPFFTTKGFHSTGLGLSVNYGIIRRHGGEVTIESAVDKGTRVAFRLPLVAPREDLVTPGSVPAPVTSPLRILVIDDEREVRNVIAEILAQQGHQVVEAAGGADGLAHLEREGSFDLLLTDLGMPGMTGWEVARAAKARRPTLRVGLITGWGEQPAGKPEDRAAADFVLPKPITVDGLRAALEHVRGIR